MNQAYSSLRERLPERGPPGAHAFLTDARRIKAWMDALPRANQQATLQQLSSALQTLRATQLDGLTRLATLEALRPLLLDAVAYLGTHLQANSFPLPQAKEKAAEQLLSFQRELALGYRLALVDACAPSGGVPFMRGAQVALALVRAISHGSRHLAESYLLYRKPEIGVWITLHALFRFAQNAGLADRPIEDPAERIALTARRRYAQALLLALSNPWRFTQREQQELWTVTRDFSGLLAFHSQPQGDAALAVPVNEDRGPGDLVAAGGVSDNQALLWVDLSTLRRLLDIALSGNVEGMLHVRLDRSHTVVASGELLQRLRQSWDHASDRGYQRLGAGHALETVVGLSSLHYHLAGSLDFDSFMHEVRGVGLVGEERAAWTHAGAGAARMPTAQARVLDQSLGGYHLAWDRAEAVRARVGELVGLAPILRGGDLAREARSWMVGVIRWLRYDPQGGVDAGVELIARRACAVELRSLDTAGVARAPMRGIQIDHLRPNGAGEGTMHFLAPSVLDAQLDRLEVARASDPERFEETQAQISECAALHILENAGDYFLLAARPVAAA